MPSKITNNLRILNVNQFMNMFNVGTYAAWTTGTTYYPGDIVRYNIQKYVLVDDGNSGLGAAAGANPPTHEVGQVDEGDGLVWQFVEYTYNMTFFQNQLYLGMGKPVAWRPYLTTPIAAWSGASGYTELDVVTDSGNYYQCIVTHTATGTAPGSDATNWVQIDWVTETASPGAYSEGDLVESVDLFYLNTTGTNTDTAPASDDTNWTLIDDETPIIPENDFENMYRYLDNLISAKKVGANEISYGIQRYDWTNGMIYNSFDPAMDDFNYVDENGAALNNSAPFYVVAENLGIRRIYKCLDNNADGASTVEPSGESSTPIRTVDGYLWQYMATVEAQDEKFISSNYIPVRYKNFDDGSTQYLAQSQALPLSISTIKVGGTMADYTDSDNVTISAPDLAGGTQATATLSTTAGVIDYVSITNQGSGYLNEPTVTITSGIGTGATFDPVMAPKDGNASNVLKELNARYLIINEQFNDDESGYFPITGDEADFRQIMLFVDPVDGYGNVCTEDLYIGYENPNYIDPTSIPAWAATTAYTAGDLVENGGEYYMAKADFTSGASFNVVNWNPGNLIQPGTGTLLYVDNTDVVPRSSGQIEDLKLVLKF